MFYGKNTTDTRETVLDKGITYAKSNSVKYLKGNKVTIVYGGRVEDLYEERVEISKKSSTNSDIYIKLGKFVIELGIELLKKN